LDKRVAAHAGTVQGERIASVPWLRYQRLSTQLVQENVALSAVLTRMTQWARTGLLSEAQQVPAAQLQAWRQRYTVTAPLPDFIASCQQALLRLQYAQPQHTQRWLAQLPVDHDYSEVARVIGLYPLSAAVVRPAIEREQAHLKAAWGRLPQRLWSVYRPQVTATATELTPLLRQHAPVWFIEGSAPANLPGAPIWQQGQLTVGTDQAVSYAFMSEGRWQGQTLTQLNYVLWFAKRPALRPIDWVAGAHDALVWRVNLDASGKVVAYDSIHLCGCWYRLFLPPKRGYQALTDPQQEPVMMQRVRPANKMAVYVSADTHQISYARPAQTSAGQAYHLKAFETLLARPVFNRHGYVPGSERLERWFLWPLGVKNPGALRRPGDHAISFIGQRYFDAPDLLEQIGVKPHSHESSPTKHSPP